MSYNIKYDNQGDSLNNWLDRRADMVSLLQHYEPTVLGLQEVLHRQLRYLDEALPEYRYVGVGRDDGKQAGEYSPIFYRTAALKLVRTLTFWLSETPTEVSVGWDAALERICTMALFEDRAEKKRFFVFNTHFDHRGWTARERSADLILQKIAEYNPEDLPVILMGDFNLTPDKKGIRSISKTLQDGKAISAKTAYGPTGTSTGFDHDRVITDRIDYIFTKGFKVKEYIHIDDRMENNRHISDHLPVYADLERQKP